MARIKVKPECRLKSWTGVDDALKRISECERIQDGLTNDMNAELEAVRERYAAMMAPVQERIGHFSADIEQFVTEHRDELKGKAIKLNFGSTGFRAGSKLKYRRGVKLAEVADTLLRLNLNKCVKVTRRPISDMLKKQPADVLDKVGAYIEKYDNFWCAAKREEIRSTADREVQP